MPVHFFVVVLPGGVAARGGADRPEDLGGSGGIAGVSTRTVYPV
jgi:hypothetical protein